MWMKGSEGLGPPDALKVFRCVVMREALRAQVHQACARAGSLALFLTDARACSLSCSTPFSPSSRALAHSLPATASPLVASVSRSGLVTQAPTSKAEAAAPPSEGNPVFWRPVSPFKWHQLWGGTSVTRGKTQGVQAWSVAELEEVDAWHGRPRGDDPNVYTLRLPGGILLQVPTLMVCQAQTPLVLTLVVLKSQTRPPPEKLLLPRNLFQRHLQHHVVAALVPVHQRG